MMMREALLERAGAILAQHAAGDATTQTDQQATVVQEMRNIEVSTPADCGATAHIRSSQTATFNVGQVLQSMEGVARDVVAAEIAAAATLLAGQLSRGAVTLVVGVGTRSRMEIAMDVRWHGFLQQTVQGRQVIESIRSDVCDVTLSNAFLTDMMVRSLAIAAVEALLTGPGPGARADAPPPGPSISPSRANCRRPRHRHRHRHRPPPHRHHRPAPNTTTTGSWHHCCWPLSPCFCSAAVKYVHAEKSKRLRMATVILPTAEDHLEDALRHVLTAVSVAVAQVEQSGRLDAAGYHGPELDEFCQRLYLRLAMAAIKTFRL